MAKHQRSLFKDSISLEQARVLVLVRVVQRGWIQGRRVSFGVIILVRGDF